MAKRFTILGLRFGPRRISFLLVSLGLFALFTLFFTLPSAIPRGPSLSKSLADHKISMPKLKDTFSSSVLNPFRPAAHPPPVQKNSTYGESSWYSNWNWRSPFSSSITLDENRSLLPPIKERPPIYVYYDTSVKKDTSTKDAESELLLTWRRAWWAQGFRPIILSEAEAMNNPLYDELQRLEVEAAFKRDAMRWLAWENMGGGLLSHQSLFPMGSRQDPLMMFLRHGEYPALTRWEGFKDALFAGAKAEITAAIIQALRNPEVKVAKDFISALTSETFHVDPTHDPLAFYDQSTLEKQYPTISQELKNDRASGLKDLNLLVNSHLHTTWQNIFDQGIAVLKPLPEHTTYMIEPAYDLAERLAFCGDSPDPSSCPPNRPKCSPCDTSYPMKISTPAHYRNTSGLYSIGTVPHPYTIQSLNSLNQSIDIPWIRREGKRDEWLRKLFKELLGVSLGGTARLLKFKEAVAGEHATAHSIWLTAEKESPVDLNWWFGFAIPRKAADDEDDDGRPQPQHDANDGPSPSADDLVREPALLQKAREVVASKAEEDVRVRDAMEAWNLADTEAWRFARAFLARSRVERLKWEEEESRYADGAGTDKETGPRRSSWTSRWTDANRGGGGTSDEDY